jgi:hypothetical protein
VLISFLVFIAAKYIQVTPTTRLKSDKMLFATTALSAYATLPISNTYEELKRSDHLGYLDLCADGRTVLN